MTCRQHERVVNMQSVRITVRDALCKVSVLCNALCAKCPYYVMRLYKVSVLCSALYTHSVPIMQCFICNVFLLCSVLYAKCPYSLVRYMQSALIV